MAAPVPPILIIGNGMAGLRLAEELLALGLPGSALTMVGAEPGGAYDRIGLSSWLQGEKSPADLVLRDADWYAAQGITLIAGVAASAIDRAARTVRLEDGRALPYARLVLATGSQPVILPIPGADLPGVIPYRTRADTDSLIARAQPGRPAIVIGGGLLGLEAAWGLAKRGMRVGVVHLMGHLLERQLDPEGGALLRRRLEERGLSFHLGARTQALIEGPAGVAGIRLADGLELPADLVCMAVGIRPETTLARAAELKLGRGILVDDRLATHDPAIFALGECADHRGIVYGLVAPVYEQAAVLARTLMGLPAAYAGSVLATHLKVTGVDVFSAGDFADGPGRDSIQFRDPVRGLYRRLVVAQDRLIGAVQVGFADDAPWYAQLIRDAAPLGPLRRDVIFGRAFIEEAA